MNKILLIIAFTFISFEIFSQINKIPLQTNGEINYLNENNLDFNGINKNTLNILFPMNNFYSIGSSIEKTRFVSDRIYSFNINNIFFIKTGINSYLYGIMGFNIDYCQYNINIDSKDKNDPLLLSTNKNFYHIIPGIGLKTKSMFIQVKGVLNSTKPFIKPEIFINFGSIFDFGDKKIFFISPYINGRINQNYLLNYYNNFGFFLEYGFKNIYLKTGIETQEENVNINFISITNGIFIKGYSNMLLGLEYKYYLYFPMNTLGISLKYKFKKTALGRQKYGYYFYLQSLWALPKV